MTKNWCFQLGFFETQNNDVEQKHNFKSAKNKDKKKGFQSEKKTGNQKETRLMKENFVIEYFDVVLFMKQTQRRTKMKEKNKNKEAK